MTNRGGTDWDLEPVSDDREDPLVVCQFFPLFYKMGRNGPTLLPLECLDVVGLAVERVGLQNFVEDEACFEEGNCFWYPLLLAYSFLLDEYDCVWLFGLYDCVCWGLEDLVSCFGLLTLVLLNPDILCLYKQCRSRSVGFFNQLVSEEANWSGSALFALKYLNLKK